VHTLRLGSGQALSKPAKGAQPRRISPYPDLVSGHWGDSLDLGTIILEHFVDNFVDSARERVRRSSGSRLTGIS
jgi:hypothetical protein